MFVLARNLACSRYAGTAEPLILHAGHPELVGPINDSQTASIPPMGFIKASAQLSGQDSLHRTPQARATQLCTPAHTAHMVLLLPVTGLQSH